MFREIIVSCLFVISANAVKNWDYTFVKLDVDIKVDYLKTDVKLERITRGDYAINGTYVLGKDLGPMFKYQAKTFRSPRGNDDYKPMPFAMPKQNFDEFFDGVYKKVLMEDLHKCSNFPYFEDKWEGKARAGTYEINMCKINVANWPDQMLPGFYKFLAEFFDEGDNLVASFNLIVEIESTIGFGK